MEDPEWLDTLRYLGLLRVTAVADGCLNRAALVLPSEVRPVPKAKLTDALIARSVLPEGRNELMLWDTEVTGFGLRLRRTSSSYIVLYRPAGAGRSATPRRFKLGTPATIKTPSEARTLARAVLGKVAAGQDPAVDRAALKRRPTARVSDLLDAYDRDLARRGYVNRELVIRGLRSRLARLKDRDITLVTGADLAVVMEQLEKTGRRGAAEDFRSKCRAFLTYCVVKAKVLPANPLAGHRKERATRADLVARTEAGRALRDDELTKVWAAADPETSFGRLVRFLILSGCRRNEAARLIWPMIDAPQGLIRFPPVFTKQGRGHDVPLTPLLAQVLDACPVMADVDLVFASPRTNGQFSGWTTLVRKLVASSGVDFTLHDLRRSFRSGLSRLGVDTETAELALGHARESLVATYNRDRGAAALKEAFGVWDAHVAKLVSRPSVSVFD